MLHKTAIEPVTLELLIKLQQTELLKDFSLAGGTSLAMQIGHRKSIDLDLFNQSDFEVNSVLEFLEQDFDFRMTYSSFNTLKGSINNIKIDLISHKYPLVKKPINVQKACLYSVEDIAAMKLNAIAGNGTRSKDFIDIYFILKKFSIEEILSFYQKKYITRNLFHVIKSLNYFDDINMQDWPEMLIEKELTLSTVIKTIKSHLDNYSKQLNL